MKTQVTWMVANCSIFSFVNIHMSVGGYLLPSSSGIDLYNMNKINK